MKLNQLPFLRASLGPIGAWLVLLVAVFVWNAPAAETPQIGYSFRTWQTDEGLPHNSVHALAQTADGFLWVGTEEGLARFDGVRFTPFDDPAAPQLRHAAITALLAASDGSLWIGTAGGGLTRWQAGGLEHWSKTNGLPDNNVRCLMQSAEGSLWVGTDQGLARMRQGQFTKYAPTNGAADLFVSAICEDQTGIIRVATRNGMWSLNQDGVASAENFGLGEIKYGLKAAYSDRAGNVWFGGSGGLRYARVAEARPQVRSTGLRQHIISAVMEDRLGQRWVGTFRGVARMRGDQVIDWPLNERSGSDAVAAIFEDREGSIWVGGRDGLYRLTPARFVHYTTRQGLIANDVMSICEDQTGALWIASWVGGLTRIYDGQVSWVSKTNGLTDDSVLSLRPARDGGLWVGMDFGRGLNKLDRQFQNSFTRSAELINAPIRALYEQPDGTVWIGTGKGLNILRHGRVETYTTRNGLAGDNVMAILEDHTGTLWVGTVGGISLWSSNRVRNLTTREGLSHNFVSTFYEATNHDLWIGTKGGGVNRWRAGKLTAYTTRDGLFNDEIFEILGDDLGCLWMSCRQGLFRVSRREFEELDQGKIARLNCTVFGRADGLETVQFNGAAKPAGWKSSSGQLWFATIRGTVAVEPRIKTNDQPPPVQLEEILADRQWLSHRGATPKHLIIPAGTRKLEIHFTTLSFQVPEKNRFRYRLEGVDSDWVEAGTRRFANYYLLRPGSYRFQVTACNNDGVWNPTGASLNLTMQPYYWQTWWFQTALALGALLPLVILYRIRVARLRELERLRIQIAADLHDDVGSRLTKVAMVTESLNSRTVATDPGKVHIESITRVIHEITRAMDEIVWTINPRYDTLDNLANYIFHYAQDYFQNTGVRCRLDLPPRLPDHPLSTEERHNLFMAVKEALNNVLKHAAATEVHIALSVTGDRLTLAITDNGRGVNQAAPPGDGLVNMQARLRQIGGRLRLENPSTTGTKVILEIKLRRPK